MEHVWSFVSSSITLKITICLITFKVLIENLSLLRLPSPMSMTCFITRLTRLIGYNYIFITISYGAHINKISKSADLYLRKIRHFKNYFSPNITKRLLYALVLSRSCYSLFFGIKNYEVIKVDRIIRSCVRLIHRLKRCDHDLNDTHQ